MLPILPQTAWREFRGFPSHIGQHKTTHYALVQGPDGKERRCVVKLIDLTKSPGLLCEGLGWMLAGAVGVQVPAFAAILRVPVAELAKCMTIPPWMAGHSEYPAWCVEAVGGKSVIQVNKWIFWLARSKCLNARNTPVAAAFDVWADNKDRNYGNVIKSKEGKYIAIDHETLLHDLIWLRMFHIQYAERSLLKEAEANMSAERYKRFQCDMAVAADQHAAGLANAQNDASQLVSSLVSDPAQAANLWGQILAFLTTRAQTGWMSHQLGVTI